MNYSAINQLIGTAWVYRENDCWAVVRKASIAVFGVEIHEIEIPDISNPEENTKLFNSHSGQPEWSKIEKPEPGSVALFKNRRGNPVHIGIYIEGGNILHCNGSPKIPGATMYEHVDILSNRYPAIEFYEYNGNK